MRNVGSGKITVSEDKDSKRNDEKKYSEKYDIFISYRRDGGDKTARYLYDSLKARGYRIFLDVEDIHAEQFNKKLYRVIENSKDFILILSPNALDRCAKENDWVRLELEHAKKCGKNIIPVRLRDFPSPVPGSLPESIEFIRTQNGPTEPKIHYYKAFVQSVEKCLKSRRLPRWVKWIALVLLCALGVAGYSHFSIYPHNREQSNVVSSLITYMIGNLSKADSAIGTYQESLDRALQSVEDKTTDTLTDIRTELLSASQQIREMSDTIAPVSDKLHESLMKSPFDAGDLDAFPYFLIDILDEYAENLDFVRDEMLPPDTYRKETRTAHIEFLKNKAKLDAEILFYLLNETLLPVTNEDALENLKKEYLPTLKSIFSDRLSMSHSIAEIKGKEEAVLTQYEALSEGFEAVLDREESDTKAVLLETELKRLIAWGEILGNDTSGIEESYNRLMKKKEEIQQLEEQLIEKNAALQKMKEEARERFRPLASDDVSMLWGKGKRFLTIKMPREATECFSLCAAKGDESYTEAAVSARKYAENYAAVREAIEKQREETGYNELDSRGGVVVCFYEENFPRQAVEIGDIIYAVDGTLIQNMDAYFTVSQNLDLYTVSIIRFSSSGFELTESVIDKSLGRVGKLGLTDEPET